MFAMVWIKKSSIFDHRALGRGMCCPSCLPCVPRAPGLHAWPKAAEDAFVAWALVNWRRCWRCSLDAKNGMPKPVALLAISTWLPFPGRPPLPEIEADVFAPPDEACGLLYEGSDR